MRGVLVAAVAAVGLLLASFATAQGLGDAADQEKRKRKAEPKAGTRVYTQNDLGPSVAPVGVPSVLPETTDEGSSEEGEGDEAEAGEDAASEADQQAEAEAAWRKKLEQARKEEQVYRDVVQKLQLELNDMSGGIYNPGRANRIAFMEENQQLLADTQQRIAALEDEGRVNRYR